MVPPQNAVALTWSANAAMHGRIEEYSTPDAATRWRLRFGASIERVAPFQSLSLTARGTSRDNRRYQRLRPAIREHDPFSDVFTWTVLSGTGAYQKLHGTGTGFGVPTDTGIFDTYTGAMHID